MLYKAMAFKQPFEDALPLFQQGVVQVVNPMDSKNKNKNCISTVSSYANIFSIKKN
jgi:hypothetical protein